jgi:hypothetical protein
VAKTKIIHTAAWQLGKSFGRIPAEVRVALAEARLDSIDRIAAAASSSTAQHVIVAGDVFDSEWPCHTVAAPQSIDIVGFLWAAMELFDEPGGAVETATRYPRRVATDYIFVRAA